MIMLMPSLGFRNLLQYRGSIFFFLFDSCLLNSDSKMNGVPKAPLQNDLEAYG